MHMNKNVFIYVSISVRDDIVSHDFHCINVWFAAEWRYWMQCILILKNRKKQNNDKKQFKPYLWIISEQKGIVNLRLIPYHFLSSYV